MPSWLQFNSIRTKLFLTMFIVLIMVSLIFITTLFGSGILNDLDENAFSILNERVANRANDIEINAIRHWIQLDNTEAIIQSTTEQFLLDHQLTIKEVNKDIQLSNQLLAQQTNALIDILRSTSSTGIFLVLDTQATFDDPAQKCGVYIRDLDPVSSIDNDGDLLFEIGSPSISQKLNISLDSNWHPNFDFRLYSSSDFFLKPYQAALQYPLESAKNLGYWSPPFRLTKNDIEVITYSLPLINTAGEPYGVIGIEISVDYLQSMLPYREINNNKAGIYMIGISSEENLTFQPVTTTGPMSKMVINSQTPLMLSAVNSQHNAYVLPEQSQQRKTFYSAINYFNLYNNNSPFENEQWALIGIIDDVNLLAASNKISNTLLIALTVSLVVGLAAIYLINNLITKPFLILAQKVRKIDPDQPVQLDKVNVSEIDDLASAIESLSFNVTESASKLSLIIDLLNIPIGGFEYTKGNNRVYCTHSFHTLLQIPLSENLSPYLAKEVFERQMALLKENPERDSEDIFRMDNEDGAPQWIRLVTMDNEVKTWGLVIDVTQETIEKRKIEYERDYDVLTQLFNRRAFGNLVTEKLQEGHLDVGAFMLWDLDNLKYINDTYGHDCGDQYIQCAANVLRQFNHYNGIVSRVSGDEFYVFLYGYSSRETLKQVITTVTESANNTLLSLPNGNKIKLSMSGGLTWCPDDTNEYDQLIRYADFAMYQAKNSLKGTLTEFNMVSYKKDSFLLTGKEELDALIENQLVSYALQPIVSTTTGEIFAYEALMRPQVVGLESPLDVLRLAKYQSKLHLIEDLTWYKALETFDYYLDQLGESKLFINSIPNYHPTESVQKSIEAKYPHLLERVVIELIESEQSNENTIDIKQKIVTRWNGQVALDDFGAGYNNDIVLLMLKPDYVKIDRTLIQGIDQDLSRQKMLQNLLSYFADSKIQVIAEGVETLGEMNLLIAYGVDYLQGFYVAAPALQPQAIRDDVIAQIQSAQRP